ncbi:MAG: DUF4158 domain-containing protein [Chloroflexi bacterium]|nr:DUF4158 domain-containing protein [Chloroflexota bacterium]
MRSETRHEHLAELRRLYGFRPFSGRAARELNDRLREEAPLARSNEDLARRFVDACRQTRTILPATTTIERLCADALVDAERRIEARIAERVPPDLRRALEHLLNETVDAGVTRFVWLRQFEPGGNSADANRLLDRLDHLQRLDFPEGLFDDVPAHRITRLRRQGERYFADGFVSCRKTVASRSSRSAPSSGRCRSPMRWSRPTIGSSAERIAPLCAPAKRSSETRPPRCARPCGPSPTWEAH